jgi:ATP-dependent RNA helicase DeaD
VREHKPRDRDGAARAPREHKTREPAAPREFGQRPVRAHATEQGKRTYRIEVGHEHGVKPGNIIGAIANEAGLDSQYIGRLSIRDHYSLIDLPDGMPSEVFEHLKKVWVVQQQLRIHEWDGTDTGSSAPPAHKPGGFRKPGGFKPRPGGGKPPRRK